MQPGSAAFRVRYPSYHSIPVVKTSLYSNWKAHIFRRKLVP
jgi:hypothetical protein